MDDELLFKSLLWSAVAAVALLQLVKLALRRPIRTPPGPWKLPVIGSMHHLVNVLPHRSLREMAAAHGPLMMLQLGETPLVVASSREMARNVLRTHDSNFATRPKLLSGEIILYGCADIVFSPSGDYWRKLRQLCAAAILSLRRVLSFRYIREDEVAMRVKEIEATAGAGPSSTAPVNMTVILHSLTHNIMSRVVFGRKLDNAPEFLAAVKAGVVMSSGFNVPDLFPSWTTVLARVTGMRRRLLDIHRTIDAVLEEIIEERMTRIRADKIKSGATENVEEDLVDVLIALQEKGGFGFHLTKSRMKAIIFDMFAAGSGTTASTMEWGMSELMRHPAVMKKLQAEIRAAFNGKAAVTEGDLHRLRASNELPYLGQVIKEVLRLHPAAPLLVPRESVGACELDGYTIPAKARVIVNAWAVGRDNRYWGGDAEEFRPERFEGSAVDFMGGSYEFVPFGSGRRMCPGINFALSIMELTLTALLYSFDWSLPEGVAEVDMVEAHGLGARRRSRCCSAPPPSSKLRSSSHLHYHSKNVQPHFCKHFHKIYWISGLV